MRWTIICCSLLGIFLSHFSYAVIFKFSNAVCESYNKSRFQYQECRLKAVSRDKVILNINGTIYHSVNNVFAHFNLYKRESGYKPWLLKGIVDCCRFMRKNYNPAAKILFGVFKEFTNINHTCPFVGPIFIRGLYLRPAIMPLPFPSGEYMLSFRWFFDQKHQADTNFSFVFVEDIMKS